MLHHADPASPSHSACAVWGGQDPSHAGWGDGADSGHRKWRLRPEGSFCFCGLRAFAVFLGSLTWAVMAALNTGRRVLSLMIASYPRNRNQRDAPVLTFAEGQKRRKGQTGIPPIPRTC